MSTPGQLVGSARQLAYAVGSAAVYLALARAAVAWGGDLLPIPLWLATAAAVAIGLVGGRGVWLAVLVGAGIVGNVVSGLWLFDETLRSLIVPGLSVAIEIAVALFLLEPALDLERGLRRTRQAMRLLGLFVVISTVGASIAAIDTSSPVIGDRIEAWEQWVVAEIVGLLVVIPLLLVSRSPWLVEMHRRHRLEASAHVAACLGLTILSFSVEVPFLYLVVASISWLSIRFGLRISAPLALAIVVLATMLSGAGGGPFLSNNLDPVLQVQIFNAVVAACALVVSAHATRAWDDQQQLAATLRALPDAAAVRSRDGELLAAWVPSSMARFEDSLSLADPTTPEDPVWATPVGDQAPARLVTIDGSTFEQRVSHVDEERELHLFRDVTEINRARRDVKQARERLHRSEAEERKRLAQALHDGPIQELSAVQLRLGIEETQPPSDLAAHRRATQALLQSSIESLRTSASSLQPPELGDRDLMAELRSVADRFFDESGVACSVEDRLAGPLETDDSNTLFLVGREALANVAFHAEAERVSVELEKVGGVIQLRVGDDGNGMGQALTVAGMHFGLQLMRERMESVGGALEITSTPGEGTVVVARLAPARDLPPSR